MRPAIGCWRRAARAQPLSDGQIDLWRFRVDLPENKINLLKDLLSADELQRAARLLIAEKRQQFIVARASLRSILARYLDCTPAELVFKYGAQGKPELLHQPAGLNFNLAHSGVWAVLAISRTGAVGVDLERIDPALDYNLLAPKFFSKRENDRLGAVTGLRRRRTFYRLWTCKESVLKLSGVGFSAPATGSELSAGTSRFFFPLAKNYLGCLSCNFEATSINRLQLTE